MPTNPLSFSSYTITPFLPYKQQPLSHPFISFAYVSHFLSFYTGTTKQPLQHKHIQIYPGSSFFISVFTNTFSSIFVLALHFYVFYILCIPGNTFGFWKQRHLLFFTAISSWTLFLRTCSPTPSNRIEHWCEYYLGPFEYELQDGYLSLIKEFNIMEQSPTIYEQSLLLSNPSDPLENLISSVIIYGTYYYQNAQVRMFVNGFIDRVCENNYNSLMNVLQVLNNDLMRQIVYGPNAYHTTPADVPHRDHLNEKFICDVSLNNNKNTEQAIKAIKQHKLQDIVSVEQVQELLWYDRERMMKMSQFINVKVREGILQELSKDGECWNKSTPYPTLLLMLSNIYKHIINKNIKNKQVYLRYGRIAYLHNKILHYPSSQLSSIVLNCYNSYFRLLKQDKQTQLVSYVSVLVEYAYVLVFYYKYRQSQEIVRYCKDLIKLQIQFTGKLGRRTKYQSFDTAQLVMNIRKKQQTKTDNVMEQQHEQQGDQQKLQLPSAMDIVLKQTNKANSNAHNEGNNKIDSIGYDEQSILLQRPKLIEQQQQQQKQENKISIEKILVTLNTIRYMWDTTPKDQILYQQISTSIATILNSDNPLSYPLNFSLLLLRSLNEFPRIKHGDRALEQFQKLKANFNNTQKGNNYLYSTAYYPHLQFIKILADKYMEIGLSMSAVELFQKVGMMQDCIDALVSRSYKQKASQLASKQLKENGKSPRLLCILGDLNGNSDQSVKLYEQAWQLSKNKFARAQRSIGWYYFSKKEFQKAAQAFSKATSANYYHPNTWFTLGCSYIKINQYQKAIKAFGECICIDDTQGQAWGNLAACYMNLKKMKQAYSTLQQAVKYSEGNWKMWSNLLGVSLTVKQFYKYFECIERIVTLGHGQILTKQNLHKIIMIFQYKQDSSERKRAILSMKKRIDRLFQFLVQKIGQNPLVWEALCSYYEQLLVYIENLHNHYQNLHKENKVNMNDMVDGYETQQSAKATTTQAVVNARENIVEGKQIQLNMIMKIGWDENKMQSERVLQKLKEYMEFYKKYALKTKEEEEKEFCIFVEGVRLKLQKCLQREIML